MQNLLNQFNSLTDDEKIAFMKEAMVAMAKIFQNNPKKMMTEMMPICMNVMKSKGMNTDMMHIMKTIMGTPE